MKKFLTMLAVVLLVVNIATADTFGSGANQFTIDFVDIAGDTNPVSGIQAGDGFIFTGVNNNYRMGVYEITNGQWDKFVFTDGSPTGSEFGYYGYPGAYSSAYDRSAYWTGANTPTTCVSWYEAAQFVNYLNISTGHHASYKFTGTKGTNDYTFAMWESGDVGYDADNPYRNSNAFYFMPTEDEWVKAAYWNGASLQTYAISDNSIPIAGDESNYAYALGKPWDIGRGVEEINGTYDMMGNVWELMESPHAEGNYTTDYSWCGLRGAAFNGGWDMIMSSYREASGLPLYIEHSKGGFRVASVPEPLTLSLLSIGSIALLRRRRA